MKIAALLSFVLMTSLVNSQTNTEIFLAEIIEENGKTILKNVKKISKNEGYNNQPSFDNDGNILFSSTRNGQTDIAKYTIKTGNIDWINNTPNGGEYSPLKIPNSTNISAIRLDNTGLQRLYEYNSSSGASKTIIEKAKIGYHLWYSKDIIVNTVLVENGMNLVISNLKNNTHKTIENNVGRSLQKIPNSDLISYIAKEGEAVLLKSIHPITGAIKTIIPLAKGTQDICWLSNEYVLIPLGNVIHKVTISSIENSDTINLSDNKEINTISRMAIRSDGKYIAFVTDESNGKIAQKQVDAYNTGNLNAFINCYSKNVVVSKFPNDTLYVGHEEMRKNYSNLSPKNKVDDVQVVQRISIGNKVIDLEEITKKDKVSKQVAIYEVNHGKIESMSFIFDNHEKTTPETIVQKQLNAYNNRDIEGFLQTYATTIKTYRYPTEMRINGQYQLREAFTRFFKATPDLNCEIKNRIVIGNKVIDEEYIVANGKNISAVAIYEVEDGKIAKVTFLR